MKKLILKNNLIKNTLILIIVSLLVKALGLLNRIVLTRLLGNQGISLYILALPTIMLFMSIAGFSLNIVLSKIVSENLITQKYKNRTILIKAILLGLMTSLLSIIILLIIIKPLTSKWLGQKETYYPILSIIFFLPIVVFNNVIRGYYNGINKVNLSAYSNLIEQFSRIIATFILIYIFKEKSVTFLVTIATLSMGLGELISLLYALLKLKKNIIHINGTFSPTKEIFNQAFPTTTSRLLTNFTFFLEPIIYTLALKLINFPNNEIMYKYSEINAYAIPLITMFSFISVSIATSISPNISKYNMTNKSKMQNLISSSLIIALIPGILISITLFFYSKEIMNLIYNTDIAYNYVRNFSFAFLIFYIEPILISALQALGENKNLFIITIISNILKLVLIFSLTFIKIISYNSLIISISINSVITTLTLFFHLKNISNFKIKKEKIINILILFIITFLSCYLFKLLINNFIIVIFITTLLFLIYLKTLKLINF